MRLYVLTLGHRNTGARSEGTAPQKKLDREKEENKLCGHIPFCRTDYARVLFRDGPREYVLAQPPGLTPTTTSSAGELGSEGNTHPCEKYNRTPFYQQTLNSGILSY